jgi:hypothetical protein
LVDGDPDDGTVSERPQVGEASRHLDPIATSDVSDQGRDYVFTCVDQLLRFGPNGFKGLCEVELLYLIEPVDPRCGPIDCDQSSSQSGAAYFSAASKFPRL